MALPLSRTLSRNEMLEIMYGTDPSFDALFTVAVRTTGIYCRPSCNPPRKPNAENVEFYPSPSEAKAAGFRACKLCRPDGPHPLELEKRLVRSLMTAVTREPHLYRNVNDLVRCAGVSSSTLFKLFKNHLAATPAEVLARVRIKLARQNLSSNLEMGIAEIAFAVGFESLSAFNHRFVQFTGLTPVQYRQSALNSSGVRFEPLDLYADLDAAAGVSA
jgi:AraC family transcriptional regulator, regulatory protein of adaptative response / DNA-3-methyladenine glycosylase II